MQKRYTNPAPSREPGAVPAPESELALQPDGYRVELQYDQLHPRDIDPSAIVRKSEGELMRTYEAKSLLSAAIDQLAMDQMRNEQANENAARMEGIARDTHLPTSIVEHHVRSQGRASVHAGLVRDVGRMATTRIGC